MAISARPILSSSDRRTSAEAAGSGTPARSSLSVALLTACRAPAAPVRMLSLAEGSGGLGGELVGPLLGGEGLGELFELAVQDGLEVVGGQADPVVGYAALREVIGADLRRAVAAADLREPHGPLLLPALAHLALQEARAENPQRLLLVLELALLVLAGNDEAGGLVCDPHRRVRGVHALPAGAARAVDVDLQVARVYLDLDVLGLRQDRDRRRRGVYAPLALRLRHPLDTVRAALVLENGVGTVALYLERSRHVSA